MPRKQIAKKMTFDNTNQYITMVVNKARQNKPSNQVSTIDSDTKTKHRLNSQVKD